MFALGKTNKLGYELYGFVAEANGKALPMLFLFIETTALAAPNAKRRKIAECLQFIKPHCLNLKFTLSDKDVQEIGAVEDVFPELKHQLCYWHVLRYISDRKNDNTRPRPYDARAAHRIFNFIDSSWVQPRQAAASTPVEPPVDPEAPVTLDSMSSTLERHRIRGKLPMFCPLVLRKNTHDPIFMIIG